MQLRGGWGRWVLCSVSLLGSSAAELAEGVGGGGTGSESCGVYAHTRVCAPEPPHMCEAATQLSPSTPCSAPRRHPPAPSSQLDSYWQLEALGGVLDLTNFTATITTTAAAVAASSGASGSTHNSAGGSAGAATVWGDWSEVPPAFRRLSYSYDTANSAPGAPATPTQVRGRAPGIQNALPACAAPHSPVLRLRHATCSRTLLAHVPSVLVLALVPCAV